jgi:bacterial/archaeal transporter family protein
MGTSQSKSPSSLGTPHLHSPRYSSIGGRLHLDSPALGSVRSLRSRGSIASLASPRHRPGSLGRFPVVVGESTPLVVKKEADRMLGDDDRGMMEQMGPPLAIWIGPALACALCYALYNIFIKKGSASINPILGGVILQFVAAFLGCVLLSGVLFYNMYMVESSFDSNGVQEDLLMWDWTGVRWAILAGFAVGAAEMISFCVNGMGVQAMQSIPVIIGGSVLFGTVLGFLVLGEALTVRGWSGVLMISIGISLVGMDEAGGGA